MRDLKHAMPRTFDRFLRWFFDASPTQAEDAVRRDPVWSVEAERHAQPGPDHHRQLRPQRRSTQPSRRA